MDYKKMGDFYYIRMDKGDEIIENLLTICKKEKIKSAIFSGIGGAAYLSVDSKILGAFLFTIGLFAICTMGFHLYTGKVCYLFDYDLSYVYDILII